MKALPYALSLAEENQANLIFLQLISTHSLPVPGVRRGERSQMLQVLVPADAENWCKPEFVVRFEFPEDGILRLAEERKADLIVMGVRQPAEGAISGAHTVARCFASGCKSAMSSPDGAGLRSRQSVTAAADPPLERKGHELCNQT